MEKKKMKEVLDWPTPKRVKDVPEVFRICQLLLVVHQRSHSKSQTIT